MPAGNRARIAAPLAAGMLAAGVTFAAVGSTSDGSRSETDNVPRRGTVAPDAVSNGRAIFARMGCGGCHHLAAANADGAGAPDLDVALDHHTRDTLRAKIVDPYPSGPPESFMIMPRDFGSRLTRAELDALVAFLLDAR